MQAAFPGGIRWVTLGEQPAVATLLGALVAAVSGAPAASGDLATLTTALAALWPAPWVLLVLDDVWEAPHADPFLRAGRPCTRLVTTRNVNTVPKARRICLDEMETSEAAALLAAQLAEPPADPTVLVPLARQLGEWPLLLTIGGAAVQARCSLDYPLDQALRYVRDALAEEGVTAFDRADDTARDTAVAGTLAVSLRRLTDTERLRYLELAIFPDDQGIPLPVVGAVWGTSAFQTEKTVGLLAQLSLLQFEAPATLRLHDVIRRYLGERLADPTAVHGRLIAAWGDLHQLSSPYSWRWLGYHLLGAGQADRWRALRLDYPWLAAKLQAAGAAAVLADFRDTHADPVVHEVGGALRLAIPALLTDPSLLAGQLRGRLLDSLHGEVRALAEAAVPDHAWLRPLTRSLWRPNPALLHTLAGHTSLVRAVAVTADGQRAVSASWDNTLRVWDLATGLTLHTLTGHTNMVEAVAVTADGQRAVSTSSDNTLRVWDLATGQALHTLTGHTDMIEALALTADGQRAVSASRDGTLRVWDLAMGQARHILAGHTRGVTAVAVTADGQRAVSTSDDKTLRVWDLATGQARDILVGHTEEVRAVAVTADGQRAVSASEDQTVLVWDLATGRVRHTLAGHTGLVEAVAVTADGQRAISASRDGTLRVWDLATGQARHTLAGHTDRVKAVAVTGDGQRAISASDDHTLRVWDLATGQALHTLAGHTARLAGVALTADGQRAVSAAWDYTLRVWDLVTGQLLHTLVGHTASVEMVAVTADGQRAVSAYYDKTLRVWDLATGQARHTLAGHTGRVNAVVVTSDGRHAVSASRDGTLRVWDLATGQVQHILAGHTRGVTAVAVAADGQRAVSASEDHTLRVWDLATGRALAAFSTDGALDCCTFAPDGYHIIAGNRAGQVHFCGWKNLPWDQGRWRSCPARGAGAGGQCNLADHFPSLVFRIDAHTLGQTRRGVQVVAVAAHLAGAVAVDPRHLHTPAGITYVLRTAAR